MEPFERYKPFILVFSASTIVFFGFVALMSDGEPVTFLEPEVIESNEPDLGDEVVVEEVAVDEGAGDAEASEVIVMEDPDPAMEDPRGLTQLLIDNRLCDAYLLISGQSLSKSEQVEVLLRSLGLYDAPEYPEISTDRSPIFGILRGEYDNDVAKLIIALRNGGLMRGGDLVSYSGQMQMAFNQLEELRLKDFRNGIYSYMQLALLKKIQGTDEQTLIKKAFDIMQADTFDTKYFKFLVEVERRSRENLTKWVLAQDLLNKVVHPDYSQTVAVVEEVHESVPGLKEHLTRIMTIEGVTARTSYHLSGYDPDLYRVGRSFAGGDLLPTLEVLEGQKKQEVPEGFSLDLDAANCSPAKMTQLKNQLKFVN